MKEKSLNQIDLQQSLATVTFGLTKEKHINQADKIRTNLNDKENSGVENINNKIALDIVDKQKIDEAKQLVIYYRSRHVSFLNNLKENLKNRKLTEENEKKKKDLMLAKIRENMGINNVASKLFEFDKNKEQRQNIHQERTNIHKEINRCQSAEGALIYHNNLNL